jgi:outer membrane lipoprotein SlyB
VTNLSRFIKICLTAIALSAAGCSPDYSPNTYNSNAVQQANKVEQGVVVGVREVGVKAAGTTGAVTGGAAGGIVGSQTPGGSVATAFGTLGGTLVGGIVGTTVEHATDDTKAFEYIVRKPNGDLVSVTQKDDVPLALGQKVLVIAGNQARIVPDYTTPVPSNSSSGISSTASSPAGAAPPKEGAPTAEAHGDKPPAAEGEAHGDKPAAPTETAPKPPEVAAAPLPPPAAPATSAAPAATPTPETPATASPAPATPADTQGTAAGETK